VSTGIVKRHSKGCPSRNGGRCSCNAGWQASVYSKRDGKKIRKTFPTKAAARRWRADAGSQLERGSLRAPTRTTLGETAHEWLRGAESGEIRNNSGHPYKPSTLRGYRQALEERVLPELGGAKLSEITTTDL
jgi:integrase